MRLVASGAFVTIVQSCALPCSAQDIGPTLEVIPAQSEWRYDDSGVDLGTDWKEPGFDDSTWRSGKAPLGYGDGGMNTELGSGGDPDNKHATAYFRKTFSINSLAAFPVTVLRFQRDDAIVLYLNGAEIYRDQPAFEESPIEVRHHTLARSIIEGPFEFRWNDVALPTSAANLHQGENVIAAEVHQASRSSEDLRFDARLILSASAPAYGEVRVGIQTKFEESGNGMDRFVRDPLAHPEEYELNWELIDQDWGNQGVGVTTFHHLIDSQNEILTPDGKRDTQLAWVDGTAAWLSERIDCRNYQGITVKADLRTAKSGSFRESSFISARIKTSEDGLHFQDTEWFDLEASSLDDLNHGVENRLMTFVTPAGLIPDSTASMHLELEASVGKNEIVYLDNVETRSETLLNDFFCSYMARVTGWALDDPRMDPLADPDADGIKNLMEFAFLSPPDIAGQEVIVKGVPKPILPQWETTEDGRMTVRFRQLAAPYSRGGLRSNGIYRVGQIVYIIETSSGQLDPSTGEWVWRTATHGGGPIVENQMDFEENEDGTVTVVVEGAEPLEKDLDHYFRLVVRVAGFDDFSSLNCADR